MPKRDEETPALSFAEYYATANAQAESLYHKNRANNWNNLTKSERIICASSHFLRESVSA